MIGSQGDQSDLFGIGPPGLVSTQISGQVFRLQAGPCKPPAVINFTNCNETRVVKDATTNALYNFLLSISEDSKQNISLYEDRGVTIIV